MVDLMHGNINTLFDNSLFYSFREIPWLVAIYLVASLFSRWLRCRLRQLLAVLVVLLPPPCL